MKLVITLILISFSQLVWSLEDYAGKKYEIITLDNQRDVNIECKNTDCLAKSIEIKHGKTLDGEDPAAVTCIEVLKGKPLQLHDGNYNERGFCLLTDQSMIGFGSIRAELIQ